MPWLPTAFAAGGPWQPMNYKRLDFSDKFFYAITDVHCISSHRLPSSFGVLACKFATHFVSLFVFSVVVVNSVAVVNGMAYLEGFRSRRPANPYRNPLGWPRPACRSACRAR